MNQNKKGEKGSNANGGVKLRVRGWFHDMRKKSHVQVQKWVDSISLAVDEDDVKGGEREKQNKQDCDNSELKPTTSSSEMSVGESSSGAGVKGRITEICNKLSVNEKLKVKKVQDLKNLIAQKICKNTAEMEQQHDESENCIKIECNEEEQKEEIKEEEDENKSDNEIVDKTKRCHISALGRSVSENPRPPPRTRRLTDIGRSFSVAHDNELQTNDSSENLIYDATDDDDTSLTVPNASPKIECLRPPDRPLRMHTVSEGHYSPHVLPRNPLLRDCSFQSDESHCSSVESLLEHRKPDAEAILMNLGFGPVHGSDDLLSKIPKRFLKPSQVKGVDTETFVKNQQLSMNIHESSVLGYRGLLGNSHAPSEIVKAIMHRFSQNELRRMESMENLNTQRSFKGVANTILAQRHFLK